MSGSEDFRRDLMNQNGLTDEALEGFGRQQARSLVFAEKRRTGRIRLICILSWALTVVVIFASMALVTLLRFTQPPTPDAAHLMATAAPRLMAMAAGMLGMIGMVAFVVGIFTSVAWYFSARTASLTAIDARLRELETILRAEAGRARGQDEEG